MMVWGVGIDESGANSLAEQSGAYPIWTLIEGRSINAD